MSLVKERHYEASRDARNSLFSAANEDEYDKIIDTSYDQGGAEGFKTKEKGQ